MMKARLFTLYCCNLIGIKLNNIPIAAGGSSIDPSSHFDYSQAHVYQSNVEYGVPESQPW